MKCLSILAVIVFLCSMVSAETVGSLSLSIPENSGWSLEIDQDVSKDSKVMAWRSGDKYHGVTLIRGPLPAESTGSLEDFVPKWRVGFEKKAFKVLAGGYAEIAGRRFGFSKILAYKGAVPRIARNVCTIVGKEVYCVCVFSDTGDPDDTQTLRAVLESVRLKD